MAVQGSRCVRETGKMSAHNVEPARPAAAHVRQELTQRCLDNPVSGGTGASTELAGPGA